MDAIGAAFGKVHAAFGFQSLALAALQELKRWPTGDELNELERAIFVARGRGDDQRKSARPGDRLDSRRKQIGGKRPGALCREDLTLNLSYPTT